MGAFLSAFRSTAWDSCPATSYSNFQLDLQGSTACPQDKDRYSQVSAIVYDTSELIRALRNYSGCTNAIRQAISNPTPENEEFAWLQLSPSVTLLRRFFDCSVRLEQLIPQLLESLCGDNTRPITDSFNQQEYLVQLLATILGLTFEFDELKMANPSIQNDFSYYRRTLHRLKQSPNPALRESIVPDDVTNQMSLFYAYPNPMLRMVIEVITQFVSRRLNNGNVSESLAVLCAACYNALNRAAHQSPDHMLFLLRVMVTSAVLYDHVEPTGVFQRSSSINVTSVIHALGKYQTAHTDNLMNALRYSTKNLNSDTTPKQVRIMLTH
ncbi:hypothetical protein IWQ61_008874 [Dispira simplex]|nr:hypothetical protein IWQ61_008874 [Dispira simplex]